MSLRLFTQPIAGFDAANTSILNALIVNNVTVGSSVIQVVIIVKKPNLSINQICHLSDLMTYLHLFNKWGD